MRYKIIIGKIYPIEQKHSLKNKDIDYWDTVDKKRIKRNEDTLFCSVRKEKFFDAEFIRNFNTRYVTTFEDVW